MATEDLFHVTDAVPLDVVPLDEDDPQALAGTPIGPGRPLTVKIRSIYPGMDSPDALLLSSVVDNPSLYDAGPRSIQYLFRRPAGGAVVQPSPSDPGSNVVFHSPAVLDSLLKVELRMSPDRFDQERYQGYLDAVGDAAGLPVFAVAATLGGPAGAATGGALVYAVRRAVKVVLGIVDRLVDGGSGDDWVATGTINLGEEGLRPTRSGWMLFLADGSGESIWFGDQQGNGKFIEREQAYVVDTEDGTLRYADGRRYIVQGRRDDPPYVLTYVSGQRDDKLRTWTSTAISAALTARFFTTGKDGVLGDVGELLQIYNDVMMVREVGRVDAELDGADPSAAEELNRRRTALVKNIQDDTMADLVTKA